MVWGFTQVFLGPRLLFYTFIIRICIQQLHGHRDRVSTQPIYANPHGDALRRRIEAAIKVAQDLRHDQLSAAPPLDGGTELRPSCMELSNARYAAGGSDSEAASLRHRPG